MSTEKKAPRTGDKDVIKPLDSHRPIIGEEVVAMDSHRPIIGDEVPVAQEGKRPVAAAADGTMAPQDSHRPIAEPKLEH
ncbi:laminin G [Streptomyces sp. Ru73]|uniref:laminin G n=1 Tax=Streptomyces sp. Ru73 TaxID=2080748 RepID=UPI000CDD83D7|nr:laminin G [Streptomyces sp. Ru73]POX39267.1 laminin G [Streptomyces sp. Ru73]